MVLAGFRNSSADESTSANIKRLFARKCLSCHNPEDPKGKLDLSDREKILAGGESGPAVTANQPEESPLWQRVVSDEMPPKHPLSDAEKEIVKSWIVSGAAWTGGPIDPLEASSDHRAGRDWWSLQPLHRIEIPRTKSMFNSKQPLDDFVSDKLFAKKLTISPEAEKRFLIRRITFDLLGLPPKPQDVERFVTDDRPDAFERLVD